MGVVSLLDATSSLKGRKSSPYAEPKGKKPSKSKKTKKLSWSIAIPKIPEATGGSYSHTNQARPYSGWPGQVSECTIIPPSMPT